MSDFIQISCDFLTPNFPPLKEMNFSSVFLKVTNVVAFLKRFSNFSPHKMPFPACSINRMMGLLVSAVTFISSSS